MVIANGSNEAESFENKQIVDNQKEIKNIYVYTAGISGNMGWWIEMHQAFKDIEFKYRLLYPDNDFFFWMKLIIVWIFLKITRIM